MMMCVLAVVCGVDLVSELSFLVLTALVEKCFMSTHYGCPLLELFILFYFIIILQSVKRGDKWGKKRGFDDEYF